MNCLIATLYYKPCRHSHFSSLLYLLQPLQSMSSNFHRLKKQDGDWVSVGSNDALSVPFINQPDKYKATFNTDPATSTATAHLEIMGK